MQIQVVLCGQATEHDDISEQPRGKACGTTTTDHEDIDAFSKWLAGDLECNDDDHSISSETMMSSDFLDESDNDSSLGYLDDDSDDETVHFTMQTPPLVKSSSEHVEEDIKDSCPAQLTQRFHDLTIDELIDCLGSIHQQFGDDHPLMAQIWNVLGLRFYCQMKYGLAIQFFQHAVVCNSLSIHLAHAYFHLARCLRRLGEKKESFRFLIRAAEAYEYFAALDAKDRSYELGLIDDEMSQLRTRL